jgi:hypothetical protein
MKTPTESDFRDHFSGLEQVKPISLALTSEHRWRDFASSIRRAWDFGRLRGRSECGARRNVGYQTWRAGVDWLGWISWTTMMMLLRRKKKNSAFSPEALLKLQGDRLKYLKK